MDKQITSQEMRRYFAPRTDRGQKNVRGSYHTDDHHVPESTLEAQQTADLKQIDRQRADKMWNDGWQAGHRAGYRDGVEDTQHFQTWEKTDGND
jgi:flagellar biosynthesis/type III secretory pathway protein FliH